ncbi:hypothetical protein A2924_02065 [Candidatus Giovannonibacteria bacterium RIFCSPLOWO2_01_FULL_44_16]|uniref:Uncharacterized protein n=1 Tax=Candidatus Giovannonibacteria bacterium RIFCSPLOWO2_01_FULL_44_16 TaxID=1798348 RepID=A0A1F5X4Q0_9BACT|nr:MAG: hypothetical protein A2924_02065 [Candidatus Giovannonibacteria bacterium RIFCSPLOWO2_01_FULL_44_16]
MYPATPTLSVEAVHERLICEEDTAVAIRPVGMDGAIVSTPITVRVKGVVLINPPVAVPVTVIV